MERTNYSDRGAGDKAVCLVHEASPQGIRPAVLRLVILGENYVGRFSGLKEIGWVCRSVLLRGFLSFITPLLRPRFSRISSLKLNGSF